MVLPGIWRGVLLKSVLTHRLINYHPLALSLGQRYDFGEEERTRVERSMEEESRAEKKALAGSQLQRTYWLRGVWETAVGQEEQPGERVEEAGHSLQDPQILPVEKLGTRNRAALQEREEAFIN